MDYKEKLRQFNSTEKYKKEVNFLWSLLGDTIKLDYGCGLGTAMDLFYCDGYDVNMYYEGHNLSNYYNHLPDRKYEDIYFLHSFAHIPNPHDVLRILRKYKARITIITPNLQWLMLQDNKGYVKDPTVVKHYTLTQLEQMLKDCGYSVEFAGQFGEQKYGFNERIFIQAR